MMISFLSCPSLDRIAYCTQFGLNPDFYGIVIHFQNVVVTVVVACVATGFTE